MPVMNVKPTPGAPYIKGTPGTKDYMLTVAKARKPTFQQLEQFGGSFINGAPSAMPAFEFPSFEFPGMPSFPAYPELPDMTPPPVIPDASENAKLMNRENRMDRSKTILAGNKSGSSKKRGLLGQNRQISDEELKNATLGLKPILASLGGK